ncbi:MAG: NADH-quinone oxidoreductase subunit L, partial [Chloroflexi bacterium]
MRPLDWLAVEGERFFDVPVVEGSLSGVATLVQDSAGGLSWVENGFFRRYALVFMGGAVLAGLLLVFIASRG